MSRLKITEVFHSLQGEADTVGVPTVFIRLTGCPLRCQYCDTAYAFHGGEWQTIDDLIRRVRELGSRYVCVTGGEPLAQKACLGLLARLCDEGFRVSLETSGAMPLADVDPRVVLVVDVKTPGSGEVAKDLGYLGELNRRDEVKFVVTSREDFDWSVEVVRRHGLEGRVEVLFSPVFGEVAPKDLAAWMLEAGLEARLSLQIHKLIWGKDARGV